VPTRLCLEPRCPNVATARGRCDEHRKAIERERSRRRRETTNGVYKRKRWEMVRRFVLRRDPICRVCDSAISAEVDHVLPLAEGGNPYDSEGLQGICSPATGRRPRGRTQPGGAWPRDGLPHRTGPPTPGSVL
jgi:5-methylcytosine-specific restriction enzyme A